MVEQQLSRRLGASNMSKDKAQTNVVPVLHVPVTETIKVPEVICKWTACDKVTGECVNVIFNVLSNQVCYLGPTGKPWDGNYMNLTKRGAC